MTTPTNVIVPITALVAANTRRARSGTCRFSRCATDPTDAVCDSRVVPSEHGMSQIASTLGRPPPDRSQAGCFAFWPVWLLSRPKSVISPELMTNSVLERRRPTLPRSRMSTRASPAPWGYPGPQRASAGLATRIPRNHSRQPLTIRPLTAASTPHARQSAHRSRRLSRWACRANAAFVHARICAIDPRRLYRIVIHD